MNLAETFFIFVCFYYHVPSAYVLLNCQLGSENEVIEKIRKIQEVIEVYRVLGVYDIIIKISASDKEIIKDIIASQIKNLNEIHSVLSMIVTENLENH